MTYSSLIRRWVAIFLDGLILFIPACFAHMIFPVLGGLVILFLYEPVLLSSRLQATIGKNLMGIRVTDLEGNRISFQTACVRRLVKFASLMILAVGYWMAAFTERKQTLHDLVAGTLVVDGKIDGAIADAWIEQMRALTGSARRKAVGPTLSELEQLQVLREKGALTEEEFQREKQRLLGDSSS